MKEKYSIKPFNTVFFSSIGIYALLLAAYICFLKQYDMAFRKAGIITFYLVDLLLFIWYKYSISIDKEYAEIAYKDHGFNWRNELPFQACNTVLFLVPIGILTMKRYILATCFFSSLIVTPMAMIMPCAGFSDYSILKPRIFGFYVTHYLTLSAGFLYGFLGIYSPEYTDMPLVGVGMTILLTCAYIINKVMIKTGKNPYANYFFCVHPDGNPALIFLKKIIPFEYFYCLPLVFVFVLLSFILTFVIKMFI